MSLGLRNYETQGSSVRLLITFSDSGTIGDIESVSSTPRGMLFNFVLEVTSVYSRR